MACISHSELGKDRKSIGERYCGMGHSSTASIEKSKLGTNNNEMIKDSCLALMLSLRHT